jgi:3-isopropylmalate/(R)-2-methylmalate dehydratase small subunit
MSNTYTGKVWKFGDDINTDLVIPNFAVMWPLEQQLPYCFSANRPGWVDEVQEGDILIGGRNLGVGSARDIGAVWKGLGISVVVAESFNGLGLRNCLNSGLPSLPCPGIGDAFDEGDVAEIDWTTGDVKNVTKGTSLTGNPVPEQLQEIVLGGGIEALLRREGYLAEKLPPGQSVPSGSTS